MVKYNSLYGLSHIEMIRGLGIVILHVSYSSFDTCNTYSIYIYTPSLNSSVITSEGVEVLHLMWTCIPLYAPRVWGHLTLLYVTKRLMVLGGSVRPVVPSLIPGVWNAQYIDSTY
jgi:hypothetical protein